MEDPVFPSVRELQQSTGTLQGCILTMNLTMKILYSYTHFLAASTGVGRQSQLRVSDWLVRIETPSESNAQE